MPKEVLLSVQPYWVFLIIAKAMGWNINKEKTVEVRKNYPKADDWDKTVKIYCSKDKKSFARIPKEYQSLMRPLLGKVVGEFVCDFFDEFEPSPKSVKFRRFRALGDTRLTLWEIIEYLNGHKGYGWHILDLVIYDKPKELSEFHLPCNHADYCTECKNYDFNIKNCRQITRPPQSWCYVEG